MFEPIIDQEYIQRVNHSAYMSEDGTKIINNYIDMITHTCNTGEVVDDIVFDTSSYSKLISAWSMRELYTNNISWVVVTNNYINAIYDFLKGHKCIELYAGLGMLSHQLQKRGLDIIASDSYEWNEHLARNESYTEVIESEAGDFVRSIKGKDIDYIIISWPPCGESRIEGVIEEIRYCLPKAKILYIGEDYGGCTGTEEMWNLINRIGDKKPYKKAINNINNNMRRFPGIYDWTDLWEVRR